MDPISQNECKLLTPVWALYNPENIKYNLPCESPMGADYCTLLRIIYCWVYQPHKFGHIRDWGESEKGADSVLVMHKIQKKSEDKTSIFLPEYAKKNPISVLQRLKSRFEFFHFMTVF